MSPRLFLVCGMCLLLLASSVSLVYVQHKRRELFMALKTLERDRDRMQVEWGQLQVEASTWAAQDRIESLAAEKLDLRVPDPERVILVRH